MEKLYDSLIGQAKIVSEETFASLENFLQFTRNNKKQYIFFLNCGKKKWKKLLKTNNLF